MIYGIGTDIINSERIKKLILKFEKKFIYRFFGNSEIELSKNKMDNHLFFSKRFAAKEAFWKAVSPENTGNVFLKDIQVLSNKYGKPEIYLSGKTKEFIKKKEIEMNQKFKFYISISDEPPHVLAFVIIFLAPFD